jgi:hypothetical protein
MVVARGSTKEISTSREGSTKRYRPVDISLRQGSTVIMTPALNAFTAARHNK